MASSMLIRLSGLAAMVGGVIYALSAILLGRGGGGTLRWSLLLFLQGMMAAIAALHFLHRGRERYGRKGALASVAVLLGVALTLGGYILVDLVISLEELGTIVFLVGALVGTMGIIGLALATLNVRVHQRRLLFRFLSPRQLACGIALGRGGLCRVPSGGTKD
jgi:hypothetical protein